VKVKIEFLLSIAPLAKNYDAFLLDLWGVIHDGKQLYPEVRECLEALRAEHKKIIFLSNAPRRAGVVSEVLTRMGITANLYDGIVTSGETAYQCLAYPEYSFFKPRGPRYFYIGLEKDRRILDGLSYQEEKQPEDADFVLLSHSYHDNQPFDELLPLFKAAIDKKLPALCINPDREVVRLGGERVYCAGTLALEYHKMEGEVIYFGKPHEVVYDMCMGMLKGVEQSRILAVGDSLRTDIRGANYNNIASALVTGGVLREAVGDPDNVDYAVKCQEACVREEVHPTYVVPVFNW